MPILVVLLVLAFLLLFSHTAAITVPIMLLPIALFLWGAYRKR